MCACMCVCEYLQDIYICMTQMWIKAHSSAVAGINHVTSSIYRMTEFWFELNGAYDCSNRYVFDFYYNTVVGYSKHLEGPGWCHSWLMNVGTKVVIFTILYTEFLVISLHYAPSLIALLYRLFSKLWPKWSSNSWNDILYMTTLLVQLAGVNILHDHFIRVYQSVSIHGLQ